MLILPELLSPAGEWDSFIAAIESGADAVYIGGKAFSARQSAGNFDLDGIADATKHAHLLGAKVYVTVNTLIDISEMADAVCFIRDVASVGADAIIIQDLGLVSAVRKLLPGVELHGSTQMTAHNSLGVKALGELGIERVVLSRELSIDDIRQIKIESGMDLEVFTHGALCICYSGQCLMSSIIGGRSGNRGRCAQPCRLEYGLERLDEDLRPLDNGPSGKEQDISGHLLSPKDLNASSVLGELVGAGIDSLKIEGRMKRPEYVATVTRVYRELLDGLRSGNEPVGNKDLLAVFNRGVTTHYLEGLSGPDMMSYKRPSNRGTHLGRVVAFDWRSGTVDIKLECDLSVGDGVEIWVTQGGRAVTEIKALTVAGNRVDQARIGQVASFGMEGRVRVGDRCFKTRDSELMDKARQAFAARGLTRRIGIKAHVSGSLGNPLRIHVTDNDGNRAEASSDKELENALKRPLTSDYLYEQLSRIGNTVFILESLTSDLEGDLIIPVSSLNDCRRRAIAELEGIRLAKAEPKVGILPNTKELKAQVKGMTNDYTTSKEKSALELIAHVTSVEQALDAAEAGVDGIRLDLGSRDLQRIDEKILHPLITLSSKLKYLGLVLPTILHDDELGVISREIELLTAHLPTMELLIGNLGAVRMLSERMGEGTPGITVDSSLGLYNHLSAGMIIGMIEELGGRIAGVCPSQELTFHQINEFAKHIPVPVEATAHGATRLMVSENCFIGSLSGGCHRDNCTNACSAGNLGIRDRMGIVFPLGSDRFCRGYVMNSKDLCMIGHIRDFYRVGVDRIRLELSGRSKHYTKSVTVTYRKELDGFLSNPSEYSFDDETVKSRLEEISPNGITKGHYFRGVLGV